MGKFLKVSQTGINRGFRHKYAKLHTQYTGYHSKIVKVSVPRSYTADRKQQFLTHFATALKEWYSSLPSCSEIEIQIALVNEKYFLISSNKNKTAKRILDEFCAKVGRDFAKTVKPEGDDAVENNISRKLRQISADAAAAASRSKASDKARRLRHAKKFNAEILGDRQMLDGLNFQVDAKRACTSINANADIGKTVRDFISGELPDLKIMLVTSDYDMHAEQKILIALCKALMTDAAADETSAVFAGTFRPCRGCFESLSLVQKYLLPGLVFGSRPGHQWRTTTRAHVEIFDLLSKGGKVTHQQRQKDFDASGLLNGLTQDTHRGGFRTASGGTEEALHYATDSDSEYES